MAPCTMYWGHMPATDQILAMCKECRSSLVCFCSTWNPRKPSFALQTCSTGLPMWLSLKLTTPWWGHGGFGCYGDSLCGWLSRWSHTLPRFRYYFKTPSHAWVHTSTHCSSCQSFISLNGKVISVALCLSGWLHLYSLGYLLCIPKCCHLIHLVECGMCFVEMEIPSSSELHLVSSFLASLGESSLCVCVCVCVWCVCGVCVHMCACVVCSKHGAHLAILGHGRVVWCWT